MPIALRDLGHEVSIEIIRTTGDRMQNIAFASVGAKGMFTREIEDALLAETIDLAVHSLKDLPTDWASSSRWRRFPSERMRAMCWCRSATADSMRCRRGRWWAPAACAARRSCARGVRISSTLSFAAMWTPGWPSLAQGKADAIILAAAGLDRLQKTAAIRERFAPEVLCPAPGQGALAIECRAGDEAMHAALQPLEDRDTRLAITAERRCLAALGGGCLVPIGAYCHRDGDELSLRAVVASRRRPADDLRRERGTPIRRYWESSWRSNCWSRAPAPSSGSGGEAGVSTPRPLAGKRILITRARHQAGRLAEALEAQGAEVLRLPTIEIIPPETYAHLDAVLEVISGFDWLIVTSANGAAALADRMQFLGNPAGAVAAFAGGCDWSCDRGSPGPHWPEGVSHAGRVCGGGGGCHAQGEGCGAACPAGARRSGPRRHPRAVAAMWSGYPRGRGLSDGHPPRFDRAGSRVVWGREAAARCSDLYQFFHGEQFFCASRRGEDGAARRAPGRLDRASDYADSAPAPLGAFWRGFQYDIPGVVDACTRLFAISSFPTTPHRAR